MAGPDGAGRGAFGARRRRGVFYRGEARRGPVWGRSGATPLGAGETAVFHIPAIPNWVVVFIALPPALVALWRGGAAERAVALILLFDIANNRIDALAWTRGAVLDAVALPVCLACVLLSRRYWTVWAAASALLSVATDILDVVAGLSFWTYASAQRAWYLVLVGSLTVGLVMDPGLSARRRGRA
jgi:hypothetical protein